LKSREIYISLPLQVYLPMWKDSLNERHFPPKNDLKMEEGCAPKLWYLCAGLHLDAAQEVLTLISAVYSPLQFV
jgi:hypothetical protein